MMFMAEVTKAIYDELLSNLLNCSDNIRYAALYQDGALFRAQRETLRCVSRHESDYYEEIIVNPTLLLLAKQRGDIDCGGLEAIVIQYGNFSQWIRPFHHGHLSVCLEPSSDIQQETQRIVSFLKKVGTVGG